MRDPGVDCGTHSQGGMGGADCGGDGVGLNGGTVEVTV